MTELSPPSSPSPSPSPLSSASGHELASHVGWRDPQSAIRDVRSHVLLWLIVAAGLTCDLWSKAWAFSTMQAGEERQWIPHVLDFRLSRNPGALFGMGQGWVMLFVLASVAALGFVLFMFAGSTRKQRSLHVALALILAGALGNLYDRAFEQYDMVSFKPTQNAPAWTMLGTVVDEPTDELVKLTWWVEPNKVRTYRRDDIVGPISRVGVVRDFLKIVWKFGDTELWPWVFNVADVWLVIGVSLLLLSFWRSPQLPVESHAESPKPAAATD